MPVKTSESNPALSTKRIREILLLENEIDAHLLNHLVDGKASHITTITDKTILDVVIDRYQKAGWIVKIAYSSDAMVRITFEDTDQLEQTRKLKAVKAP